MAKKMKKWLKILLGVVGVLVLGLAVLIILNWESVDILTGTQNLSDQPGQIPDAAGTEVTLRDKGDADWPCWRGSDGDSKSTVTGIVKDWSKGLKKLWDVDYLCQGKASATWSAPVVQGDVTFDVIDVTLTVAGVNITDSRDASIAQLFQAPTIVIIRGAATWPAVRVDDRSDGYPAGGLGGTTPHVVRVSSRMRVGVERDQHLQASAGSGRRWH